MKDVELKVMCELMKNSRRSDRELARAIGSSQPTVTRIRNKLEREGYINEYTMVPNFAKLGYHLFALTFVRPNPSLSAEQVEEARKNALEQAKIAPSNIICMEKGMGLGYTVVIASFHEDYASYEELSDALGLSHHLESTIDRFLINLDAKTHYRSLTLAVLAQHLSTRVQRKRS